MSSDYSRENVPLTSYAISRIVDQILFLHQCSKIQKFQIITDQLYECEHDPTYKGKMCFVVRKQTEELILKFSPETRFRLPELFFCQPSLVKLELSCCSFNPRGMVKWESLKYLSIENCNCTCEVIRSIVSGSPLLQSLELKNRFYGDTRLVIASKSLKRLVVYNPQCCVDISCPNLVEFDGRCIANQQQNFGWSDKILEKFLSDSPLLESLKLEHFEFYKPVRLVIASASLKRLALKTFIIKGLRSNEIDISCPHLEEFCLFGWIETIRLMNLSSSVCAYLGCKTTAVKQILESVQHLNELKFRFSSALEMYSISHPLLKCKSLTLEGSYGFSFEHICGIAYALRSSPVLERLVVKLQSYKCLHLADLSSLDLRQNSVKYCLHELDRLVITSKSLKRLVVVSIDCYANISCPNLVEFNGSSNQDQNFSGCDKILEKFLSDSPLLESVELKCFEFSSQNCFKGYEETSFQGSDIT